jgi:hypothetical protein
MPAYTRMGIVTVTVYVTAQTVTAMATAFEIVKIAARMTLAVIRQAH